MTRVFYASTLFGALSLAAALDAGRFGERSERRLLLTATNTNVPEIASGFARSGAFAALRPRFDDVIDWNELIAPLHPADWRPPAAEAPLLARLLADRLELDTGVSELVVESVAVSPARAIAALIRDCPMTVYSDGLMSYGPTRTDVSVDIGLRVHRLLHLDLVPGVEPLLLRENATAVEAIPDSAFTKIIAELPDPTSGPDAIGCPVILGQYLAPLQILSIDEEHALLADMLRGLAARGHRKVVFKPHPGAGRTQVPALVTVAAALKVRLIVADDTLPVEAWFAAARPELVVSCFSTALLTAAHYFGIATATMGGELVLERLTPYQNSNRIPATLVDAIVPRLDVDGRLTPPPQLPTGELIQAVGYCMQAERNPDLRPVAEHFLHAYGSGRYFKQRRLAALELVPPSRSPRVSVGRATQRARRIAGRGKRASARAGAQLRAAARRRRSPT